MFIWLISYISIVEKFDLFMISTCQKEKAMWINPEYSLEVYFLSVVYVVLAW